MHFTSTMRMALKWTQPALYHVYSSGTQKLNPMSELQMAGSHEGGTKEAQGVRSGLRVSESPPSLREPI